MIGRIKKISTDLQAYGHFMAFRLFNNNSDFCIEKIRYPNSGLLPFIEIDPQLVKFKCNIKSDSAYGGKLFRGGDWDVGCQLMSDVESISPRYITCKELMADGLAYDQTTEYKYHLDRIERFGTTRGGMGQSDVSTYMAELHKLYLDVQRAGRLKTQRELGGSAYAGEITCVIDRHGSLMKSTNGNHRMAIALYLKLKRIPVQVMAIHPAQLESVKRYFRGNALEAINDYLLDIARKHQ